MSKRCNWCGTDPLYVRYHDEVWGQPVLDDKELFAKLCLDGQQAGLSWITILRKQDAYYELFADFEPDRIVRLSEGYLENLLNDKRIIRNRLKIASIVKNAQAYLRLTADGQSFSDYLWQFVGGKTVQNQWASVDALPTQTEASEAMSKALKKQGFSFVGPTICYAFMQAVGMVNDHIIACPQHESCKKTAKRLKLI